jgi:hypothetical protein
LEFIEKVAYTKGKNWSSFGQKNALSLFSQRAKSKSILAVSIKYT